MGRKRQTNERGKIKAEGLGREWRGEFLQGWLEGDGGGGAGRGEAKSM